MSMPLPRLPVTSSDPPKDLSRAALDHSPLAAAVIGAGLRLDDANRAWTALLGKGGPAVDITQNIAPDDRQAVRLRIEQLLRGEVAQVRFDCRVLDADGEPRSVILFAAPLPGDVSAPAPRCIMQLVDVDGERRASEALARSEGRLDHALEAAGQGAWDFDAARGEIFYSPTWRTMRGFGADEAVDTSREAWLARVHPDDVPRILATVDRQESGEPGYDAIEYRELHRDGRYIWILSRGRPIEWDAEGRRTRTVGTDTDITHLKMIERQLAGQTERFRITLQAIADGVIATDGRQRVAYMNPMAELMTGWREADALGRPLTEVFVLKSESTGETATNRVEDALQHARAEPIDADVVLVCRDGTGRDISGNASPLRADDGRLSGAVLVFRDVSDSQEVQRRLAHSANHDGLTGLPNRSAFLRALDEARRQAVQERRQHALCYIDLDRFKPVNDTAGHAAGDALLQKVAQVIRRSCRAFDFAARIGGDEFVLLLSDCPVANAEQIGSKIVAAVAEIDFAWNGRTHRIGASVGVAPVTADPGHNPLHEADASCYAAKAAGRGRVVVAVAGEKDALRAVAPMR